MLRHIEGRVPDTNLISLPDDLFESMGSLTYLHLGLHPNLMRLPSLDGLKNLKSVVFAALLSVTEIPSFQVARSLERVTLFLLPQVQAIPRFNEAVQLSYFAFEIASACCNGYYGACNLNDPICATETSCRSGEAPTFQRSSSEIEMFSLFHASICKLPISARSDFKDPTKATIDACGGVMYRECHLAGSNVSYMCYSEGLKPIFCVSSAVNLQVRRQEILRHIGVPCDPVEEAWLGCPTP